MFEDENSTIDNLVSRDKGWRLYSQSQPSESQHTPKLPLTAKLSTVTRTSYYGAFLDHQRRTFLPGR